MMKKAVFCLLVALMLIPVLSFAQKTAKAGQIVIVDTVVCNSFTWDVNDETYDNDAVVTFVANDTTFILNLTISGGQKTELYVDAFCSYDWRGETILADTVMRDTLQTVVGCDSIIETNIVFDKYLRDTVDVITCHNYEWRGEFVGLSESGFYSDTIVDAVNGCDTIHVLNFEKTDVMTRTMEASACGKYVWTINDTTSFTYTESTADQFLKEAETDEACDTMLKIDVTITFNEDQVEVSQCGEYVFTYSQYGETLRDTIRTAGIYYDTAIDNNGCETRYVLNMNVVEKRVTLFDTNELACDNYYRSLLSGDYNYFTVYDSVTGTTTNLPKGEMNNRRYPLKHNGHVEINYSKSTVSQCFDSTISVNVKVVKSGLKTEDTIVCESYRWIIDTAIYYADTVIKGKRYHDTTVMDTIRNYLFSYSKKVRDSSSVVVGKTSDGCDSVLRLRVTVRKSPVIEAISGKYKVLPGETAKLFAICGDADTTLEYKWSYNDNGTLVEVVADTLYLPNRTSNTDVALRVTDTAHCYTESWITILYGVGIANVDDVKLSIYPNPTAQMLNVSVERNMRSVAIYNVLGAVVAKQEVSGNSHSLNLSALPQGTYTLSVEMEDGQTAVRKFIKSK